MYSYHDSAPYMGWPVSPHPASYYNAPSTYYDGPSTYYEAPSTYYETVVTPPLRPAMAPVPYYDAAPSYSSYRQPRVTIPYSKTYETPYDDNYSPYSRHRRDDSYDEDYYTPKRRPPHRPRQSPPQPPPYMNDRAMPYPEERAPPRRPFFPPPRAPQPMRPLSGVRDGRFLAGVRPDPENVSSQTSVNDKLHYVQAMTLDCAIPFALACLKQVLADMKATVTSERPMGYIGSTFKDSILIELFVNASECVIHMRASGAKNDNLRKFLHRLCKKYWKNVHSSAIREKYYEHEYCTPVASPQGQPHRAASPPPQKAAPPRRLHEVAAEQSQPAPSAEYDDAPIAPDNRRYVPPDTRDAATRRPPIDDRAYGPADYEPRRGHDQYNDGRHEQSPDLSPLALPRGHGSRRPERRARRAEYSDPSSESEEETYDSYNRAPPRDSGYDRRDRDYGDRGYGREGRRY